MTHGIDSAGRDYWVCDICKNRWYAEAQASVCESVLPIAPISSIPVGTKVKAFGKICTVYKVKLISMLWSNDLHHTLGVFATIDNEIGAYFLTSAEYEFVKTYTEQDTPVIQFERAVKV